MGTDLAVYSFWGEILGRFGNFKTECLNHCSGSAKLGQWIPSIFGQAPAFVTICVRALHALLDGKLAKLT